MDKKERMKRLMSGTDGNIVDTNSERWYNVGDWVKVGPGEENLSMKRGEVALNNTGGIGFKITPEESVFDIGANAAMSPDPTKFALDGWTFNPLAKHISVGSIVFPFQLFEKVPPIALSKMGETASMIKSILGELK